MASIKNIPYGFNANYETVIKIIGSKYVKYLVEKPDSKAKHGTKAETQSMFKTLPPYHTRQKHGNPPDLNKSSCQQINYGLNDEQQNNGEKEGHKSQQVKANNDQFMETKGSNLPNTHCVSAPFGDKSLSYMHMLLKPSIGAQTLRQHERQQDTVQKPPVTYEDNEHLLTFLRKELETYPLSLITLEKLQEACKVLDPRVSGLLPQTQLSHLLLKHEIPLQLPTVKLLFKTFSKANDQELVNYEKLVHCLTLVAVSKMQNSKVLPEKSQKTKDHSERWKSFVEFLKEVQDGTDPSLLVYRRGNKGKIADDSQVDKGKHNFMEAKTWKHDTPDSSDSEEQDAWIDRFRKLEKALYLSDIKNTGKLNREKAKRLVHNYNQIYDLCLSPLKIDKAFQHSRPGQDMPLEPLLHYLKEL
ncbi:uncharacterized protein C1orf87 homolog isoform X3 [Paroedura picta]|uniref:uncharacterized protein C1orf87 homolog isoform X3 n=1 Tax=Paroedura picta TaxID=143630 RepID=UPI0040573679